MERIRGPAIEFSQVPSTLHGQLFLLAYDSKNGRFDTPDPTRFGCALGAAMLTDLYLRGYVVERNGYPVPGKAASPDDPVLHSAFAQVGVHNRATWSQLITGHHCCAASAVREQLIAEGWLRTSRTARLEPYDEQRIEALAQEATRALSDAIVGCSAEPWSLAVGSLATLAELPSTADFVEAHDPGRLRDVVRGAAPPIAGLADAIRSRSTW